MKSFIKKYHRWIITVAAVLLLAVVCGKLFHYAVYRSSAVSYMHEVYGGDELEIKANGALYYKTHWLQREIHVNDPKRFELGIDSENYEADDVIRVSVENKDYKCIEFYSEQYLLQIELEGKWYIIHTGEIDRESRGELMQLERGQVHEFEIPLDSIREVDDDKIELWKGKYRLCKKFKVQRDNGEWHKDVWLGCEFEIV